MLLDRARTIAAYVPMLRPLAWRVAHLLPKLRHVEDTAPERILIGSLRSGTPIGAPGIRGAAEAVERKLASDAKVDRVGIHRDISEAIFARSQELFSGSGLPQYLRQYTYPPFLAIHLTTHCNAACFFCREADHKGNSVELDNVYKLRNAIRNARAIDLTGWGEPFFFPHLAKVLDFIFLNNPASHIIQVTTNASYLSPEWGRKLRGKMHRLVISLNAASSETYATQMRFKNSQFTFEKTLSNIRAFQAELNDEDRSRIILHMVANADNYAEIPALVRVAAELGIPVVSVGHYICHDKAYISKSLLHVKPGYNAAIEEARAIGGELKVGVWGRKFFTEEASKMGADSCMSPFEQCFIEAPGTMTPCCFMGHTRMGSVYEEGFEPVWFGNIMQNLRVSRSLAPCKVCTIFNPFDLEQSHISARLLTGKGTAK